MGPSLRPPCRRPTLTDSVLDTFAPPVQSWFRGAFAAPTRAQTLGWPAIRAGRSTLLLAPTGSGKTLAAFLTAIDRLMFGAGPAEGSGTRVLYISPLKALGVDVERNLRAPLAGIRLAAERDGVPFHLPTVGVRTGDTSSKARRDLVRTPPDILITTPESLYLMLTSRAREGLRDVETVIVDEIHAMAASKRGTHLVLSLERLERIRRSDAGLQRIGLSATQRPLDVIARLLGGYEAPAGDAPDASPLPRPVDIVDASERKVFDVRVEVPVEDMARLGEEVDEIPSGPASAGPARVSIWPSIHPRLLELIRAHRSTLIFVNSRRLAERLSGALNELAEEEIVLAHHGSVAPYARAEIEDRLKRGDLPALAATSSLELGIDMGAIDLVVQIEAPPSVASGIQRFGRAGHQVGAVSHGVIFPKYRVDLLASATVARHIRDGWVEETRYPRNPLDVLAQQIVAILASGPMHVDDLFTLVRGAAPFAELPRAAYEGVLDMLSGRFPSDDFRSLRPRVTWDRVGGMLEARRGARLVAVVSGGTIPDRGLYGVFLAGSSPPVRVGELDEEMVFESREGDVFLLGASSWRIQEIDHDRVLVTPAPGEPGKMPFWRGEGPGRPVEFGRAIGTLAREIDRGDADAVHARLTEAYGLDERAARNLMDLIRDQADATGSPPTDRSLVLEQFTDEVGDWTVALLSPFGTRVHAPWAMAVATRLRQEFGIEVDHTWSDDGMVFRLPESDEPPDPALFFPSAAEVRDLVMDQVGGTALFAARFRENAARALLLPRRRPGKRTPLWVQRRRSADLLRAVAEFPDFPIVLETYRDCLQDVFDMPGLIALLEAVENGTVRTVVVGTSRASPFASSLMFGYVANFLYDGDAPLAERRAQALMLDHARLLELLGEPELRELLDPEAIETVAARVGRRDGARPLTAADDVHDALLVLGDLSTPELRLRAAADAPLSEWLDALHRARRVLPVRVAGQERWIAAEDAGRYRDALGLVPEPGLPVAFLEPVPHSLRDLVARYARTHGPFPAQEVAERLGIGVAPAEDSLTELAERGRVLLGQFLPGGTGREWCDTGVLKQIKRASLARLRSEIEPVEPAALARFSRTWHGLDRPGRGLDAVYDTVERLQATPIPSDDLERLILPGRVRDYDPRDLDELCATGEVVWRGVAPVGSRDGRISLFLREHFALLAPERERAEGGLEDEIRAQLLDRGAMFFAELETATGAFVGDLLPALWSLVWAGEVTNDTLAPLRSLRAGARGRKGRRGRGGRRRVPPGAEGRWSLLPDPRAGGTDATERATAAARQLLQRHGVLTREAARSEGIKGGFSGVYPVLKELEAAGRIRRGYFVEGLGATQFAQPGAEERLRRARDLSGPPHAWILAATDPANPYGSALPWPDRKGARPGRKAGAQVVLVDGELGAWVSRSGRRVLTFLEEGADPAKWDAFARALADLPGRRRRAATVVRTIDGDPPDDHPAASYLRSAGFRPSPRGWIRSPESRSAAPPL